jgi:hypothetical protein
MKYMVVASSTMYVWYNDDTNEVTDYNFKTAQLFDDKKLATYAAMEQNKNALRRGLERNWSASEYDYDVDLEIRQLSDECRKFIIQNEDCTLDDWESRDCDFYTYSACTPEEFERVYAAYDKQGLLPYCVIEIGT